MTTNSEDMSVDALQASLSSEREWRNVQHTVTATFRHVAALLVAQSQQIERLEAVLQGVCEAQRDAQSQCATRERHARKDAARREKSLMVVVEERHEALKLGFQNELTASHEAVMQRIHDQYVTKDTLQRMVDARMQEWDGGDERTCGIEDERLKQICTVWSEQMRVEWLATDRDQAKALDRQLQDLQKNQQQQLTDWQERWRAQKNSDDSQQQAWCLDMESKVKNKLDRNEAVQMLAAKTVAGALKESEKQSSCRAGDTEDATHAALRTEMSEFRSELAETGQFKELKRSMQDLLSIVECLQTEHEMLAKSVAANHKTAEAWQASRSDSLQQIRRWCMEQHTRQGNQQEFHTLTEQVALMRRQLRSEMYQARYIWKSGRPMRKSHLIPWTTEVVNTCPEVFTWPAVSNNQCSSTSSSGSAVASTATSYKGLNDEEAVCAVTTALPGLYHLQAAFFTSSSPVIRVLVNNEPALEVARPHSESATNDTELVFSNSFVTRRLHHRAGQLSGIDVTAFLALPARALVSISYSSDEHAQGFLNLRKL